MSVYMLGNSKKMSQKQVPFPGGFPADQQMLKTVQGEIKELRRLFNTGAHINPGAVPQQAPQAPITAPPPTVVAYPPQPAPYVQMAPVQAQPERSAMRPTAPRCVPSNALQRGPQSGRTCYLCSGPHIMRFCPLKDQFRVWRNGQADQASPQAAQQVDKQSGN